MGIIRTLLAFFVVIAHTEPFFGFTFMGGDKAVELFFIISGFYMAMILNEKYLGEGSYSLFIKNRFLKIYPTYWVVFTMTLCAFILLITVFKNDAGFRFYIDNYDRFDTTTLLFLILSNLIIFGQDILMFLGIDQLGHLFFSNNVFAEKIQLHNGLFVPQAWTLGIELTFYLIAPFLVRKSILWIVLLLLLSFSVRYMIYYDFGLKYDPWTHRFFFSELGLFLMGVLAYRIGKLYQINNSKIFLFLYFIIIGNLIFYELLDKMMDTAVHAWAFYLLFTISLPFIFTYYKSSKIDRFIGELSYPIYISHVMIIGMVHFILKKFHSLVYLSEISFLLSIVFSYFLIFFILNPIEKIRRHNLMKRATHDNY